MVFIKIIKTFSEQDTGDTYVAIAHINIYMNNMRKNLENVRKIVLFMGETSLELLVIPYFDPYGPILTEYGDLSKKVIKKYSLTIRSRYLSELLILSRNHGINILLPGFIEKAGSREYLSAMLFRGDCDEVVKYRKIFLSENELKLGLSRGSEPGFFNLGKLSFSLMLDSELYYPELSRLLLLYTNFLIVGIPQNIPLKNYFSIVKTISEINSSLVLIPGSRVYHTDKLYYSLPTIIVDENGDIAYRYSEDEQAVILIPVNRLNKKMKTNIKDIEIIYRLFKKYLKKRRLYGDRESISY
uniref:Carbon-nitrogen hydrolase family protein n=2 Tax=Staphylothermus marinus TaxID=2280 RepID=A0A7C4D716_STAMA